MPENDGPGILGRLQNDRYRADVDYRLGSPHLRHWAVFDRVVNLICDCLGAGTLRGLPSTVLEVGAGHGGMTEPVLARGYEVTVTEMSRPSAAVLAQRFTSNDRLHVVYDADGSLGSLGSTRFGLILCSSVLHHIPDYLEFVDRLTQHLEPDGSFVSVQDPLRYDRISPIVHRFDRLAYLTWRMQLGNRRAGLASLVRRLRGTYREDAAGDMIEYHVVRNGVDHEALELLLRKRFVDVRIQRYWSHQSVVGQWVGDRLGMANTFAIRAEHYRR